jgi:hypothetical protein
MFMGFQRLYPLLKGLSTSLSSAKSGTYCNYEKNIITYSEGIERKMPYIFTSTVYEEKS